MKRVLPISARDQTLAVAPWTPSRNCAGLAIGHNSGCRARGRRRDNLVTLKRAAESCVGHGASLQLKKSVLRCCLHGRRELAVVMEPPETGAGGSSESPNSTRIVADGIPSASAATAHGGVSPVPISCVALDTTTVPSANMQRAPHRERYPDT